jgi:tripeptide aminopeptidase
VGAAVDGLLEIFLELARRPSPSGSERDVADFVLGYLREAGFDPIEDDAAAKTGAGSGNIIVVVAGAGEGTPIVIGAHMDTVAVSGPVEPVVENGVVRSAGDTILGADDKAACTVLLALLRELAQDPPQARVTGLFTVSEEIGLLGAKALMLDGVEARAGFVFDSEGVPGTIVTSAPSLKKVKAEFHGVAAHAGIAPEHGRSAIVAASRAIAAMPLGRIDEETTANVGLIDGGAATNVVPERCTIEGEARSRNDDKLAVQVGDMLAAITTAAAETGVDVTTSIEEDFRGFALGEAALPVRIARAAADHAGFTVRIAGSGGGSDVNVFNAKGLPSVNLGVGYQDIHSPAESMSLERLADTYRFAEALVRAAGEIAE